jgi:signal transduction histidine kinase
LESQLTQIEQALRACRPDQALELVRRAQAVTERGYSGMVRGDMLIGIILRNIREERIDPSDFQVLSMATVVHTAMESYAFGRGQRERVRVLQAEDFSVRGEENLLIYVLFNLLQNALVFEAGRPDLVVEIRFARDGDGGRLSVRDNGPGIPPERLPGIFESFMTYANKQGTGLGLPFCKRVMTALGGGIDVHSTPGEGTEFQLHFPPVTVPAPVSAVGAVPSRA